MKHISTYYLHTLVSYILQYILFTYLSQGRMQDFSGGGPNFKISGILDTHAAKRHVASSEAASLC